MRKENDRSGDRLIHDLKERVKELNCLYGISKLVETPQITIEGILNGATRVLSLAWQYPEITVVKIVLDDGEYISGNWLLVKSMQTADIVVEANKRGFISVGYIEERPEKQEGPFLKEERFLLDTVAERLGKTVERLENKEIIVQSEEKYRDLYENAPNAYFSVGTDGIIKKVNKKAVELIGRDTVGELAFSLYADTPDGKEKAKGVFEKFKSGQKIINEELQMQRSDSKLVWVSLSVTPIKDEAGNVVESRSVVVDITGRKTYDTYLKTVKEQWEKTFNSVSDSIFLMNRANTVLQANPATAELLGIPIEEIIGKKCYRLIHGLDSPPEFCVTCEALTRGVSCSSELYEPFLDKCLSASADSVLGTDGSVEFVVHTIRDITERKRWEDRLKEAEEKYRTLAETLPQAVYEFDFEGRFLYANKKGFELFGYKHEDMDKVKVTDLIDPSDYERVGRAVTKVLDGRSDGAEREYLFRRKDGSTFPGRAYTALISDNKGERTGIRGIMIDITEEKEREDELRRRNIELKGFAHTVSHDLKGPITTISMACEMMGNMVQGELPEDTCREVNEIMDLGKKGIQRADTLINDLLFLAEAGKPTDVYPVNLNERIDEVIAENKPEIEKRNIEIKVDPNLGKVVANPTHMYQVFANLVKNCVRHCESEKPILEIRKIADEGSVHSFQVRDNGEGIPEDVLDDIFVPFVKSSSKGDTGIGLSIVEKIVKTYGGEIVAYNDNGAVFEFTLEDWIVP